jgi:2-C-methyl-D-erythritol 4-phosphate cytidylyltransferase
LVRSVRNGADASLPLWDVPDVVKQRSPDGLVTVGRNGFGLAQVPMAFRREALLAAHEGIARVGPEDAGAVEDSALIESAGGRVEAVPGEVTNVHVVDAASLALARHLVSLVGES